MKRNFFLILFAVHFSICLKANIKLPLIFGSNMVLQRDKEVNFWGTAEPAEQISMKFRGSVYSTTADIKGNWKIILSPQQAGGPYEIEFKGNNLIVLRNILFGDVWLCGGQSNMQFKVNELTEKSKINLPKNIKNIRLFNAGIAIDYVPKNNLASGEWIIADSNSILNFSAVAFFFGKYLQDSIPVPIGLISDNLGATTIEEWMSPDAISKFNQFESFYTTYLAPCKSFAAIDAAFQKIKLQWEKDYYLKDDPGLKEKWFLPTTDISAWATMKIPSYWEEDKLADYDGSVWFRRNFDLQNNDDRKNLKLSIGSVNNYNIVWVNGVKIGEGFGSLNWNAYAVPDSILKNKGNVIVVRVFDAGGKGGIYNLFWDQRLAGEWHYKTGRKINSSEFIRPLVVNADLFGSPSILYNGCIAPITSFSIKGFIWYQGEANVSRAEEYQTLFPAMISDWRNKFNDPDLPFLFVQLANYNSGTEKDGQSAWAELRDAQLKTLSLSNTGMAVAIDLGEANDIHPKNKMEVGKRLAIAAFKVVYERAVIQSPVYDYFTKQKDSLYIYFKKGSGNLISKSGNYFLKGFQIAGSDKVFYPAKAFIANNHVVVYHPAIKNPAAVRYAWADNPEKIDLYNQSDLPASPFRTDNWDGITKGKKFEYIQ